jgi:hypothetical protein
MDVETIVIAVISLLICGLPFWFMIRNRKKNESKMISDLAALSGKKQLKLTKYELTANLIIGLDDLENTLYFLNKTKNGAKSKVIDLTNYDDCEVIRADRSENEHSAKQIQSLVLRFLPKHNQSELINLPIYDADESGALSGELQLANEWCQCLKVKINQSKTTKN